MNLFEFDPTKNLQNIRKHKIDLETGAKIFDDFVIEFPDERYDYDEERLITLGMVDNRVLVVVYTWRGEKRRIISARKATKDEQKIFSEAFARDGPSEPD